MSTSDITYLPVVRWAVLALAMLLTFLVGHHLAGIPPLSPPRFGVRGRNRVAARHDSLFRLLEPLCLVLGGWIRRPLSPTLRGPVQRLICTAGEPNGLEPEELLARCALSLCALGTSGWLLMANADISWAWRVAFLAAAAFMPLLDVRAKAKQRAKELERSLPSAMDLCALCMGAGADFPQSLRFSIQDLGAAHAVCLDELGRVLDELALGRTRVEALSAMGERTDSHAVKEFVSAICQSEEKGTPLVEALTIQANTLRQRRSVLAEEMAAKAAVKMMFPVMLMVAAIFLIVLGPMIVNGTGL